MNIRFTNDPIIDFHRHDGAYLSEPVKIKVSIDPERNHLQDKHLRLLILDYPGGFFFQDNRDIETYSYQIRPNYTFEVQFYTENESILRRGVIHLHVAIKENGFMENIHSDRKDFTVNLIPNLRDERDHA